MLLAIEFDNLHQILRSLYTDMMPLCGNMAGGSQRNSGTGGFVLCGCQSMAVARQCGTDRRLPFAPSFCDWFLYYVLPHIRTGYD